MEVAELVITVEHRGAAYDGHEDDIGGDVLRLEAITRLSPSVAKRLHRRLARHQRVAVGG